MFGEVRAAGRSHTEKYDLILLYSFPVMSEDKQTEKRT